MRINVSEPRQCGCVTCVHHRTSDNVIGSSANSIPVSSEPVQALGDESSPLGSTSTSSLVHSSSPKVFRFPPVSSEPAQALGPIPSGSMQGSAHGPSLFGESATSASSTSSPVNGSLPTRSTFAHAVTSVSSAPVQALGTTTTSATFTSSSSPPFHSSSPTVFEFPPAFTLVTSSGPAQASVLGSGLPNIFKSAAPAPTLFSSSQGPTFGSGASATSTSSTSSPFSATSPFRLGSMQAPVQASAPNASTPFIFLQPQDSGKTASAFPNVGISPATSIPTVTGSFGETHFPSSFGTAPKSPFDSLLPGFGLNCLPEYSYNLFGPNPQTATPVFGCGSFFAGVETEQGSRYPQYAPTPNLDDFGDQGKMMISISASNSHRHKSHEELRWEDYKNGDKGGSFPSAHTYPIGARTKTVFSSPTLSPSLFASPSIPYHPQRTTIDPTQGNMTDFTFGYTPIALQSPLESAGVSSPAYGCTACGATSSSSSASGYLGFNVATNPPSAATSLPELFFSTSGSCPLMFGTPTLIAHVATTTPAVQAYPMILGTNLVAQGTTTIPTLQPYSIMFGTPNVAAQVITTAPAVQAYHVHDLTLLPFATMNLQ